MRIIAGDFHDPQIIDLLSLHFAGMRSTAPAESCHVLPIEKMKIPELQFWAAWEEDRLMGFGALLELNPDHGEVKSMHTAKAYRNRGVGQAILSHLVQVAKDRGMKRLSLETGASDYFVPARSLYLRNGFQYCEPFGNYVLDPNSVFMTLEV